ICTIALGGEAVPNDLAQALYALGTVDEVGNGYGPTEDTTYSTYAVVGRGADRVLIGRPLANTRAHVLDAGLRPVPVGVAGELYLAGHGLSRGYAGHPALTAERFVPDPFGAPGSRMYRVMDRVRWTAEGELEYFGRTDFQVKVRGFRIEPGEIETALRAHPSVQDAVAVVREDAPGDRRIAAYLVAAAGADVPPPAELRAWLKERVPEYMVPSAFVALETLPLTPNGKTDRRALPAPDVAGDEAAYVAPRGPAEEIVAGIFADVLGAGRIGATDDFFALGGHSLLATRVVSRVREAFGAELPLRALFEAPTVESLAARIGALARDAEAAEVPPLVPVARDGALPLSFAQQRLWFLHQLDPASPAYLIPAALRLRGALDVAALERALAEVVRRHEALRTTFHVEGGQPVQVIAAPAPLDLPVTDLRALPRAEREDAGRRVAADEAARPFDLERERPLHARLVRLDDDEWQLSFTMHHIASDGWSTGVLVREVSALYGAFSAGLPSPLRELPIQYADFAAWQRAWLGGGVLDVQLDWWRGVLAGAPPLLELPTDRPRPLVQGDAGGECPFHLPRAAAAALRELARKEGATPFMVLLAAWQALLARYAGTEDVSVGTPIAGRTRLETEGLIGFFVNTLVLRTDTSGDPSLRALLGRVRETTLGAYQHQDIPFEKLVEELQPERSLGHTPFFQAMLILQNHERGALRLGAVEAELLPAKQAAARFDLTLALAAEEDGALAGTLSYRAELFDAATAERMLEHFAALLAGAVAGPDRRLSHVPLLGDAERERVLRDWNATDRDYPADVLVHHLFAAQAARTPDATALVFRGEAMTYGALEAGANRLANHLRRLGAGPESRVGVCMKRAPEMVVALLGVLKAGGAYVPLDPAYPRERLGLMVRDAGIRLVLTTAALADRLPGGAEPLCLDALRDRIASESSAAPESGAGPENLSHVIFTSGSTGRPKGVMVRHASVATLLHWMRESVADAERAAVLGSTSISFDVSVAEIFGALCWGGTVVLVESALDLPGVADRGIRYASMVPAAAAELLRSGGIPASLRSMNLAGEALPADLAQALYGLGTIETVRNLYGPTEDTSYSTCWVVERGARRVLIGRPLANSRAYVLDAGLRPAPAGVPGELYLGGAGVARGYEGRPALTAERFLPDPFGPAGSRMYRTMDRVRWTASGELEYLGRTDFQVKVRGFRIELGEIEAALRERASVGEAVAVVREDAPGDRRLVAYVVPGAGAVPAMAELRAGLRERLPEYMVP
ncbi:MAG: amino acid adenylation domain-containing protein, partial [Gemmatimonadetes bacterium]|nr:amino acid adenylation domain-containing protein [Gemmatimonadota bacterium]